MELQLYINNKWERLESDSNANTLTLSHTFESIENPSDYFSDFSYPFKLPKTSRNNILLSHVGRIDSINSNTPRKYDYRLYGDGDILLSEGVAMVTSASLKEYQIQLNGSLGISFNRLVKSGFADSDDPQYYKLPDIISWNGSDYTAKVELNNKLVYTSFNVNSQFIPFEIADLYNAYGDLFFSYYFNVENRNQLTEQMAWFSSFVGFLPQMQGRYKNFDSTKWVNGNTIRALFANAGDENTIDVGSGATEFQMQQYRSYYQTPFVYVQKLWEVYKQYCPNITGYNLNLDSRWYNDDNALLRDIVYTLPNIGNSEKINPNVIETDTTTGTNNITFPSNNQYDHTTHRISGLNDSNHTMSFYSELKTIEKNELLNFTAEIPIVFENNFDTLFATPTTYNRESDHTLCADVCIAYNQKNPLYVQWSVVDSSYNTVYTSTRPFLLIPLVKTPDFTEEWDADYRTTFEERADVVTWYYTPDWFWEDHDNPLDLRNPNNIAHFGTCQLQSTWQNTIGDGQYRIKFQMHFLFDLVPFRQFNYQGSMDVTDEQNGHFRYCTSQYHISGTNQIAYGGYCNPLDNNNAYVKFTTNYTAKTQVYEPSRSYRHITTADLFGDEKPFNILLKFSKMYNLVWNIDEKTKTINVLRKYDYLSDCIDEGFEDITERVNADKDVIVEPQTFNGNRVLFAFQESQDKYCKEYSKKYGNTYGSLTVYTQDKESSETIKAFEKDTAKFYPPIVATDIVQTYENLKLQNITKAETPVALPSNQSESGEFAGDSGVFYLRGYQWQIEDTPFVHFNDPQPFIYITDDSPVEVQANTYCFHDDDTAAVKGFPTHYLPQFYEHTRTVAEPLAIWFGEPREMYYNVPQSVLDSGVSVYDSEWGKWVQEVYNTENKRVTVYAVLNNSTFDRLKANPLVKLENAIFLLEKLEYNSETKNAKLTMRTLSALPDYND